MRYWRSANELYIKDGSPVSRASTIDPETYAERFREFGNQAPRPDRNHRRHPGEPGMLRGRRLPQPGIAPFSRSRSIRSILSVHNAHVPLIGDDDEKKRDLRTIYRAMVAAPANIAATCKPLSRQIDQYAPGREGRKPFIAVTEWAPRVPMGTIRGGM